MGRVDYFFTFLSLEFNLLFILLLLFIIFAIFTFRRVNTWNIWIEFSHRWEKRLRRKSRNE